jgi:hypothetical protein
MKRCLLIRPEAEVDITHGAVWYESRESGLAWSLFRKFIRQPREQSIILNPLRVFGEIQQSVVFSVDGFLIALSSCSC